MNIRDSYTIDDGDYRFSVQITKRSESGIFSPPNLESPPEKPLKDKEIKEINDLKGALEKLIKSAEIDRERLLKVVKIIMIAAVVGLIAGFTGGTALGILALGVGLNGALLMGALSGLTSFISIHQLSHKVYGANPSTELEEKEKDICDYKKVSNLCTSGKEKVTEEFNGVNITYSTPDLRKLFLKNVKIYTEESDTPEEKIFKMKQHVDEYAPQFRNKWHTVSFEGEPNDPTWRMPDVAIRETLIRLIAQMHRKID